MIGFGRYNLLMKLGQGGMGAVYLARQKTLRRFCAIKVISPQYSQDKEAADRFLREARATAALSHPNLVGIFDCDQFEGQYFIAMEYVEGMSLGEILRAQGPIPLPLALYWLNQAAVGLEYIHGRNIIHRDIKPDNMIVDATGNLKIMDLGLAKDHFEGDQGMTVTGTVMGSPHYMSPEQINDSKTVDHRTDLYSLGISLYQMVAGNVPYRQTSAAAVCVAHLQEPMPSVGLTDMELSEALDGLIGRITAKNRNARIASATDLVAALQPWITNYPMDENAQAAFSQLGFDRRKVNYLLEKEGVDGSQIDANLAPVPDATAVQSQFPPPSPGSMPAAATPFSSYAKWLTAGATAVVLLFFVAKGAKKRKSPPPEPPPVAQQTREPTPSKLSAESDAPTAPARPNGGTLVVRTHPEKAIVSFRGKSYVSPAEIPNVPAGEYPIKISLPPFREIQDTVVIQEDNITPLDRTLKRTLGSATIITIPAGAEVIADGVNQGRAPVTLKGDLEEKVECKLRLEGYEEAKLPVYCRESGETNKVTLVAMVSSSSHNLHLAGGDAPRPDEPGLPPSGKARGRQFIESMFEQARATSDQQWPDIKSELLSPLEDEIKKRNPADSMASRIAIPQIGKILDSARQVSDRDFEIQKERVVREVMMIMGKAIGLAPPEGDQIMESGVTGKERGLPPRRRR